MTDSTDSKKPCERKAKNTFAHVCKICIYAKFAYMQITSMCTGFKSTKSSMNGVCMLSLSRVNISYMCLNICRSYWNVCVGRKHVNSGELSEGFFLV